MRNNAILVETQ